MRATCWRIESSASKYTPRSRTSVAGCMTVVPTVICMSSRLMRRRLVDMPNHRTSNLLAFSCSRLQAHQARTSAILYLAGNQTNSSSCQNCKVSYSVFCWDQLSGNTVCAWLILIVYVRRSNISCSLKLWSRYMMDDILERLSCVPECHGQIQRATGLMFQMMLSLVTRGCFLFGRNSLGKTDEEVLTQHQLSALHGQPKHKTKITASSVLRVRQTYPDDVIRKFTQKSLLRATYLSI